MLQNCSSLCWFKRNTSLNETYVKTRDKWSDRFPLQMTDPDYGSTHTFKGQCWKSFSAWFSAQQCLTAPMDAIIYIRNHFVSLLESLCGRGNCFLFYFPPSGWQILMLSQVVSSASWVFFSALLCHHVTQVSLVCRRFPIRGGGGGEKGLKVKCFNSQNG